MSAQERNGINPLPRRTSIRPATFSSTPKVPS